MLSSLMASTLAAGVESVGSLFRPFRLHVFRRATAVADTLLRITLLIVPDCLQGRQFDRPAALRGRGVERQGHAQGRHPRLDVRAGQCDPSS